MQAKSKQLVYHIVLAMKDGQKDKVVVVKAASQKSAEDRALKRNPGAVGIVRDYA